MRVLKNIGTFVLAMAPLFGGQEEISADDRKMQEAKTFVEAGDYDQARAIYKYLLEKQVGWKREILLYDIATTYLDEGRLEEAIHQYEAIPLGIKTFPPLLRSIKTNEAVARWRLAKQLFFQIQQEPHYFYEDYLRVIFLLKKALINIEEAEKAECQVLKLEGDTLCVPTHDLSLLRSAVKGEYASLLLDFSVKQQDNLSLNEGIPMLLAGINGIEKGLGTLQEVEMNPSVKTMQMSLLSKRAESWLPVVASLEEKAGKLPSTEMQIHFSQTQKIFINALDAMNAGEISRSIDRFKEVENNLNELLFQILEANPLQETIQKLLTLYQRVLKDDSIQEEALYSIAERLKALQKLYKKKGIPTDSLDKAYVYLRLSRNDAHKGMDITARIYLYASSQEMRRISWGLDSTEATPKSVIERSISEQLYSLTISQFISELEGAPQDGVLEIGISSQKLALAQAEPFWERVLNMQKQDYEAQAKEGKEKRHPCQYLPWSEAVPLFDKGYGQAADALKILLTKNKHNSSLPYQQGALRYWQQALHAVNEPAKQDSCQKPPQEKEKPKNQETKNQPQQNEQPQSLQTHAASLDEVLRLLQQMEHDDRQEKHPKMMIHTGEKEW